MEIEFSSAFIYPCSIKHARLKYNLTFSHPRRSVIIWGCAISSSKTSKMWVCWFYQHFTVQIVLIPLWFDHFNLLSLSGWRASKHSSPDKQTRQDFHDAWEGSFVGWRNRQGYRSVQESSGVSKVQKWTVLKSNNNMSMSFNSNNKGIITINNYTTSTWHFPSWWHSLETLINMLFQRRLFTSKGFLIYLMSFILWSSFK